MGIMVVKRKPEKKKSMIQLKSRLKKKKLQENLQNFYQLTSEDLALLPEDILRKIAENRGCLKRGGALDEPRVENLILRDFRQGKLGRLSFDYPNATAEV